MKLFWREHIKPFLKHHVTPSFCIFLINYNLQPCWQPLKVPRTWIYCVAWATTRFSPRLCTKDLQGSVETKAQWWQWLYVNSLFIYFLSRCSGKAPKFRINLYGDGLIVVETKACSRSTPKMIWKLAFTHGGLNCSLENDEGLILTWPTDEESHMAVVYCRSSSGALSFKSNVSIATTTLDTWLGLSGRANQKQAAQTRASRPCRQLNPAKIGEQCSNPHTDVRLCPSRLISLFWYSFKGASKKIQ